MREKNAINRANGSNRGSTSAGRATGPTTGAGKQRSIGTLDHAPEQMAGEHPLGYGVETANAQEGLPHVVPLVGGFPAKSNGGAASPLKASPKGTATEIDFAELEDGSLLEMVEDPTTPSRTLLAVYQNGEVTLSAGLQHQRSLLVPIERKGQILQHLRLARGASPYQSPRALLSDIEALISRCVDLPSGWVVVLANFVLSTWVIDRLPVAPYVALVGMPGSGKTTLLKVLGLLCRRALLTADITSAAFYEACSRFTPTLLIDETRTHQDNRYLCHLLRMGTTRDVLAMRKNQAFHAFGAKVVSFIELPDDPALNSRFILITMKESTKPDLMHPTDPEIVEQATRLQEKLLRFRLDHYATVRAAKVPGSESLRPRVRELLSCLAAPCAKDPERCESLLQAFRFHNETTREPLPPVANALLSVLFRLAHPHSTSRYVTILFLAEEVQEALRMANNPLRLSPRKIGSLLTSFGLRHRERTNQGWMLYLTQDDRRQIHQLVKSYGIDNMYPNRAKDMEEVREQWNQRTELLKWMSDCPLCQEFGFR